MTNQAPEIDTRLRILNTLLTTPHKKMDEIHAVHQNMVNSDPLFYQHLAVWYCATGAIRDHKEAFITNLVLSQFDGHRDIGLALLRDLPSFQIVNIVDFIHGKNSKKKVATKVAGKTVVNTVSEKTGLGKNIPRSMVTEITNYLREREDDATWFESNVLVARKALKRLYSLLHIKPSDLAQAVLFDDKPPEGSRLEALKKLANVSTPSEQAKIIMDNKIPFRVATTVVHQLTPTVMLALLEVMSPQELINSIGMLKKRGVFDNPELSQIVTLKLEQAKKSKKVSGLKALEAVKASGITGSVADSLNQVADAQVKSRGKISTKTCLIVDKSTSMTVGIEIGKAVAGIVAPVCTDDFYVYAVDSMPYKIQAKEHTVAGWNDAFKGIKAGGWTIISSVLNVMMRNNEVVEQFVLISDQGEQNPKFSVVYQQYCEKFKVQPRVVFINCGKFDNRMENDLLKLNVDVSTLTVGTGTDYYSLPGLVDLLSKGSRLDLLMEIMQTELPERKKSEKLQLV